MQLVNYYLDLRTGLEPVMEGQPVRVTLDQLASKLYCSTRNVKLLLKKMAEQGWISWNPGRGRGNASELTFLISAKEMVTNQVMELAGKGDYNGAIEMIHQMDQGEALQGSFIEWLSGHFGYRSVRQAEQYSDTLRFPVYKRIATLDPAHTFFAFDCHLMNHIFDTLVRYDQAKEAIRPHLAHFWEVSEDQRSWTFYLRKGVLFHHGREMTAADVRYSLLRLKMMGEASSQSWLTHNIEDIEVVNPYKVRFHLKRPNYLILMQLTFTAASIVPEDFCRDHQALFSQMPIGTGPFRLERNDEYTCRLQAFGSYFNLRPHLDQIEIWFLPQGMLPGQGSFDLIHMISEHEDRKASSELEEREPDWSSVDRLVLGCSLLTFNMRKAGPQRHPHFRTAIDLLLDRKRMISELGGTREAPAAGFLPNSSALTASPAFDLAEAKRLLGEMGYNGEVVTIYIYEQHREDSQWIKQQCALAGIAVEVFIYNDAEMTEIGHIRQADMILYQMCMESGYELHLIEALQQSNSYVRLHMDEELLEAANDQIAEVMAEPERQERIRKLDAMFAQLQREQPFLFVLHRTVRTSYHTSVKGISISDLGWVDFRRLWFVRDHSART